MLTGSFDEVKDEELLLATVHCDGDARLARVEDETDEREDWNDGSSTLLRFRDCASDIRAVTPPRAAGGGDEEDAGSGYNLLPSKLAPAVHGTPTPFPLPLPRLQRTTPPLPPPPPSSIPHPNAPVRRVRWPRRNAERRRERCWITTGGMHRLSLSIVSIILTHNPTPTRTAALPVVRRIGVVLVCDVARSRTIRHSSEDVADERRWHVLRDAVMDREVRRRKRAAEGGGEGRKEGLVVVVVVVELSVFRASAGTGDDVGVVLDDMVEICALPSPLLRTTSHHAQPLARALPLHRGTSTLRK
ncbi:hypothetical protein R3P38DRAFT_3215054 [Favolaschia claudopus]|uniref:Uncharacterized protein n=1 Tax=Favolaschia claudopus TaxID=2862362 RepID=A0AAW0A8K5_9AGAR